MLRRSLVAFARRPLPTSSSTSTPIYTSISRMASSSPLSQTPMEDAMRSKITAALAPSTLEIHNDSHLHSHHKAMRDSSSQETHFRVVITSEAFGGKMQPARHRMVYALLKEEMAREGGIHALQLRTRTLEEERKHEEREKEEKGPFASTGKA